MRTNRILCISIGCNDSPLPLCVFCRGCFGRIQANNELTEAIENIESFESNKSEVDIRRRHTTADKELQVVDTIRAEQSDEEGLEEEEEETVCDVQEEESESDPGVAVEQAPKRRKVTQPLHEPATDSEDNYVMFDA